MWAQHRKRGAVARSVRPSVICGLLEVGKTENEENRTPKRYATAADCRNG